MRFKTLLYILNAYSVGLLTSCPFGRCNRHTEALCFSISTIQTSSTRARVLPTEVRPPSFPPSYTLPHYIVQVQPDNTDLVCLTWRQFDMVALRHIPLQR